VTPANLADNLPDSAVLAPLTAALALNDVSEGLLEPAEQYLQQAEARQRPRLALQLQICIAVIARRCGQHAQARTRLRTVLPLIQSSGAWRMVLIFPELLPLLRTIDHPAAAVLIERFAAAPVDQVGHFSTTERRVLRLFAGGAGRRAIAAQLMLSEATVKWYLNRIYRRVGVSGRQQLQAWLREHPQV
jgi:DNA-binding CsgD family transcriptional regulator